MTIIGISYNSSNQLFSGEAEHTAFLLYNIFHTISDVILINNSNLPDNINIVGSKKDINEVSGLDILIDIDTDTSEFSKVMRLELARENLEFDIAWNAYQTYGKNAPIIDIAKSIYDK
jgi:hypothetical protein